MKIALVYPRTYAQFKSNLFPLGIVYIATVLKRHGFDVRIFDSSWDKNLTRITGQLKSYAPDIVGVSASSDLWDHAKDIISLAKEMSATTICGGPHASAAPQDCLKYADLEYVLLGEGEQAMLRMVEALAEQKSVHTIPGIGYKTTDGSICITKAEVPVDIDSLPFPDRRLIPNYHRYLASGIIGISTTRGCPYNCKFCQPAEKAISGGVFRKRRPELIAKEIRKLYEEYHRNEFYISDDLFTEDIAWIEEITKALARQRILGNISFIILSRIDTFSGKLARTLNKMGVKRILFGIESGSQKILDYLNKGITVDQIKKTTALARSYHFKVHGLFILGTPLETEETLAETEALIDEIVPDQIMFSIFTALPGTYFYDEFAQEGTLSQKAAEQYDFYEFSPLGSNVKNTSISHGEITAFKDKILAKRREHMLIRNAKDVLSDLTKRHGLQKMFSRWQTYQRCKHFFG